MIAGHYATALVAEKRAPSGHIAYYLAASQLPDLAWYGLSVLGLAPAHSHQGPVSMELLISHDLIPTLGWIALAVVVGRGLFGAWRPGMVGGVLVAVHLVADLLAGYPHNVMGPETPLVGTGLYFSAPYVAAVVEAISAALLIGWVVWRDRLDGVQQSRRTLAAWAVVFGGGIGTTLFTAPMLAAFDPNVPLERLPAAALLGMYCFQIGLLTWGRRRPQAAPAAAHRVA